MLNLIKTKQVLISAVPVAEYLPWTVKRPFSSCLLSLYKKSVVKDNSDRYFRANQGRFPLNSFTRALISYANHYRYAIDGMLSVINSRFRVSVLIKTRFYLPIFYSTGKHRQNLVLLSACMKQTTAERNKTA